MRLTTYSEQLREQLRRLLRSQLPFYAELRLPLSTEVIESATDRLGQRSASDLFPFWASP